MSVADIVGIAASLIGIGAVVFGAGAFAENVKANTKATDKLSDVIDGHLTWSAEMARETAERFHEHDTRLTVVEEKLK